MSLGINKKCTKNRDNNIILAIHDQSKNNWMCWCYSLATMMHVSLKLLTTEALESKEIDQSEFDKLMTQLNEENFHKKLRNELAVVVFPIPMNSSPDKKQFDDYADISIVVERVSI